MEYLTLAAFCAALLLCILFSLPILWAMLAGLVFFLLYSLLRGHSLRDVLLFSLSGISSAKNVLLNFLLIGLLTALWRQAGTIPVIVSFAAKAIRPAVFLLMTFLLNCLLSVLTGTAFGTAATMGVICGTIGAPLGVSPALLGGAVLSGVYFGDRCSPVSTSALLTATLTGTDIFTNIKAMLRSALPPFLLTCGIYGLIGAFSAGGGSTPDLTPIFAQEFVLSPYALLPAAVLLVLSLCKVSVKLSMLASIIAALPICLLVQHTAPAALPHLLLAGFAASHSDVAAMLNGGGIISMLKVAAIVCISSAYSGIFQNTDLLTNLRHAIGKLAERTTPFAAVLLTSAAGGMIACNQTLTILLTDQLSSAVQPDHARFALALEDSAVVVAALVPWSIACAVPLTSVGAPTHSIVYACFLYLLPLWHLLGSIHRRVAVSRPLPSAD